MTMFWPLHDPPPSTQAGYSDADEMLLEDALGDVEGTDDGCALGALLGALLSDALGVLLGSTLLDPEEGALLRSVAGAPGISSQYVSSLSV